MASFYFVNQLQRPRRLTYSLYLRLLGVIYFTAFASLALQVEGLLGSQGILPVADYLPIVQRVADNHTALPALLICPTLCWFFPNDWFLNILTIGGSVISLLLVAGYGRLIGTFTLYLFYLSLVSVGQDFLTYQWDMLLLQAGFMGIIVALLPAKDSPRLSAVVAFFFFWLNFKLMFSSGICKIESDDPTWINLTALSYHFSTQPLPTPLALFANAMPISLSKAVCWLTLAIEIGAPFLLFASRKLRFVAMALLTFLQIMIMLTGNYCFFNLLTIVLLVPLADDHFYQKLKAKLKLPEAKKDAEKTSRSIWHNTEYLSKITLFCLLTIVGCNFFIDLAGKTSVRSLSGPLLFTRGICSTFGISNSYGLFAAMTLERPEIIVEGSNDGTNYLPYLFKYKVSKDTQAPPIVAPQQPRLDWQMWFEGLNATGGDYNSRHEINPEPSLWFVKFMARLAAGDKTVLGLLAANPFANAPPKYLRARIVNYTLVSPQEHYQTHKWWKTTDLGVYFESNKIAR